MEGSGDKTDGVIRVMERADYWSEATSDAQCESQHSTSKGREGWQEAGRQGHDQERNVPMLLCSCYQFRPTRRTHQATQPGTMAGAKKAGGRKAAENVSEWQ